MIKCRNAVKYRGLRFPKCNNGHPCQACMKIWNDRNIRRMNEISKLEDSHNMDTK